FAEPLLSQPGLAGVAEAERVRADNVTGVEHLAADNGVPEGAGVAKHSGPAGGEEDDPDGDEYDGLTGPPLDTSEPLCRHQRAYRRYDPAQARFSGTCAPRGSRNCRLSEVARGHSSPCGLGPIRWVICLAAGCAICNPDAGFVGSWGADGG